MSKGDKYIRATRNTTPYQEFRSQRDLPHPDIYLRESLIEGFTITERVDGFAKLLIVWDGGQTIEGWLPATCID